MSNEIFPLPLYLNQKYVFDLLAMMEGGFHQLETIKTKQSESSDASRKISGEVGVSNVFSFLGIKLGGERNSKNANEDTEEKNIEKVHTPNSLFAQMRNRLYERGLVKTLDNYADLPHGFVEFRVQLHKNPLIEALEGIISIGKMASIFTNIQQPQATSLLVKNQQQKNQPSNKAPKNEFEQIMDKIEMLINSLKGGNSIEVIGTYKNSNLNVILGLEKAFLSDLTISDLVDGEYTVFGKVVRSIGEENEAIDLLRHSDLGKFPSEGVKQMIVAFQGAQQLGFKIPEIVTEIKAPVVQVLPIGIFV